MQALPDPRLLLVLLPVVLALIVLNLTGARQPRSSAENPSRPEEPARRKRPGWLARWRARRGVRHRWNRWMLGFADALAPVGVQLDDLRHHTLICGATGSGKTSALRLLIDAFADALPIVVVDCKASTGLIDHIGSLPNAAIWTIGGNVKWDPLRGDPTSVANRLIQGEWFSREGDIYRATGERYLLWVLQAIDLAKQQRTPDLVLQCLEPTVLLTLLRSMEGPDAERLAGQVARLGQTEKEGIAGIRARFGLVLEGVAAPSLGPGLALEHAMRARQPVLFSLDAATYPELATKIGAWILLDLVRVAAARPGPCLVIIDEFSALGQEGRHVVPLLARSRESGMMCVLATQGLADLARVDRDLPQQITQNTAVRLALRQGSADDQEAWSMLLGGAPLPFDGGGYVRRERARAVGPDELAMLRTGEAFLQVMPGATDGQRHRLWIATPKRLGATLPTSVAPNSTVSSNLRDSRDPRVRTGRDWAWPETTSLTGRDRIGEARSAGFEWTDWTRASAIAERRPSSEWLTGISGDLGSQFSGEQPERAPVANDRQDVPMPRRTPSPRSRPRSRPRRPGVADEVLPQTESSGNQRTSEQPPERATPEHQNGVRRPQGARPPAARRPKSMSPERDTADEV